MAVVSRIVVRNSDISGAEGADTFVVKAQTFKVPGFSLDLTPAEQEDVTARLAELSDAVAALITDTLGEYLEAHTALAAAGTNTSGGAADKAASTSKGDNPVRTWGRANGFKVGDRGKFSDQLLKAYSAAQREAGNITNLDTDDEDREPTDAELLALTDEV
jgi:hypothetical protein